MSWGMPRKERQRLWQREYVPVGVATATVGMRGCRLHWRGVHANKPIGGAGSGGWSWLPSILSLVRAMRPACRILPPPGSCPSLHSIFLELGDAEEGFEVAAESLAPHLAGLPALRVSPGSVCHSMANKCTVSCLQGTVTHHMMHPGSASLALQHACSSNSTGTITGTDTNSICCRA